MNIAIGYIYNHIFTLNYILRSNFKDSENDPGNIVLIKVLQYHIKSVQSFGSDHSLHKSVHDPNDLLEKATEVAKMMDTCGTGVYVHRDWKGVLGLAYMGTQYGFGLCNDKATFVVTSMMGMFSTSAKIHMITTVHEIAHNLGAHHDPESPSSGENSDRYAECSADHGYVMSPKANGVDSANNLKLSPCSISNIQKIINVEERRTCLLGMFSKYCT